MVRAFDLNWMQVERYLESDDRVVVPVGSTEQHAYLSLGTDAILAERLSVEAAEPLGTLVLPAMPFGVARRWAAFPGTVTLRVETLAAVLLEVLESLHDHGFRRFLVVNGHGGNEPVAPRLEDWGHARTGTRVRFHSWWNSRRAQAVVDTIHSTAGHASWLENFPWTRLPGVEVPSGEKPAVDEDVDQLQPAAIRQLVGDGECGGPYARSDDDMLRLWNEAVSEVRELLELWP